MSAAVGAPAPDHLVVLADTLAAGALWCERVLGVAPVPGGRHTLFGTHNGVLAIGSPQFPLAYLEIIAVDPQASPQRVRWFDMDDESLRARVRAEGPRLIHWVARVPDAAATAAAWAGQGIDAGEVLDASRMTPAGLLQWQITVRLDGRRLFDGCLPTLIQWGQVHPAPGMPASGLVLTSIALEHPEAAALQAALEQAGLRAVPVRAASRVQLRAEFLGPRGPVVLAGP